MIRLIKKMLNYKLKFKMREVREIFMKTNENNCKKN